MKNHWSSAFKEYVSATGQAFSKLTGPRLHACILDFLEINFPDINLEDDDENVSFLSEIGCLLFNQQEQRKQKLPSVYDWDTFGQINQILYNYSPYKLHELSKLNHLKKVASEFMEGHEEFILANLCSNPEERE